MISSIGDLSKSAGGKLNLNSLLGVNMMMILGAETFPRWTTRRAIKKSNYGNKVMQSKFKIIADKADITEFLMGWFYRFR
jgi:hypothetical protein